MGLMGLFSWILLPLTMSYILLPHFFGFYTRSPAACC